MPFSIKTEDGQVYKQPGNFNYLIETAAFGTDERFAAKGVEPDLDGDGKVEFGEAVPDARLHRRRRAGLRDAPPRSSTTAAGEWEPTTQDALTALVVMTPTMSEYFERLEELARDRRRQGHREGVRRGLAPSGHRRHPRRPRARLRQRRAGDRRAPTRRQPRQTGEALKRPARVRRAPRARGGDRPRVRRPGRRRARHRGAGTGRGDRRPDLAGRRQARDRAGDVADGRAAARSLAAGQRPRGAGPRGGRAAARDSAVARGRRGLGRARRRADGAAARTTPSGRRGGRPRRARAYDDALRPAIRRADPKADARARRALADARRAVASGDEVALGAARGAARAALLAGAFAVTRARGARAATPRRRAAGCCCASSAPRRASRGPGTDATLAVAPPGGGHGERGGGDGGRPQGPARRLPGAPARAARRGRARRAGRPARCAAPRPPRRPPATSRSSRARYRQERGAAGAARGARRVRRAAAAARAPGRGLHRGAPARRRRCRASPPRPFGPARRRGCAQQLLRFLALVPVEYGRGVSDGRVTKDFEIQEAVTFRDGAAGGVRRPAERDRQARRGRAPLAAARPGRAEGGARSRACARRASVAVRRRRRSASPSGRTTALRERDAGGVAGGDRRVRLRPDRAHARPHGGFGGRRPVPARPSRRGSRPTRSSSSGPSGACKSFDPGMAIDVEGLIWFGVRRHARASRS